MMMKNYIIVFFFLTITLCMPTAGQSAEAEYPPEMVKIKTSTQTFNRYYYFALKDGRIFHKPNTETTGKQGDWKPFLKTGLPHNKEIKNYPVPSSILAIHADADELVALSDAGRFYWLRLEKGHSWKGKVWNHLWGWPKMEPLHLQGRATHPRAWAIGRRNKDVLYHEDIDGNQHHFGTMGITTLYVLTADGREICFTDSGLPADFSHTITLPDRGKYIAESMSVSASTLFVINAAGKMYTRLVDFDTIGSDPMFFKYSYYREKRNDDGKDWNSNFTIWSLPAEDWQKQPDIELNGQAAISSMITILQNGHGNKARELRVAGKNAEGKTGYFHKMIFDEKWSFTEYPVILAQHRILNKNSRQEPQLTNGDIHYYGRIRINGEFVPDTAVELLDFNLSESPATLRITEKGYVSEMKLHTVEAWIYLKRNDPGRDGTPKIFLGTLEIPNNKTAGDVMGVLRKHHLKTFRFIVEATREHVYLKTRSLLYGDVEFILSTRAIPENKMIFARTYGMAQNGFDKMAGDKDLIIDSYHSLSSADIPLLKQKINLNRQTKAQINAIIEEMEKSSEEIRVSSARYTALNTILHATGLFLLDKPKLWTVTRHFGAILKGYRESYDYLYFTGKLSHEDAIRRINNRIEAYSQKIKILEGKSSDDLFFSENFTDYFRRLGISNAPLEFVLSGDIRATCDTTPVNQGQSFFFINLGRKDKDELITLIVTLPKLEREINRQTQAADIAYGKYKAKIYLFENQGNRDAAILYENIFARHFLTSNAAYEINASLIVDHDGWQLYDTSGFNKNQIWVKHKNRPEAR
ncbi:MAG TPA: hypothetical protein PLV50_12065 [Smithella sp.]|nr:hypothetical protein [Smithella sp.]HOG91269.1 hypothetical protein [Smithella sp.]